MWARSQRRAVAIRDRRHRKPKAFKIDAGKRRASGKADGNELAVEVENRNAPHEDPRTGSGVGMAERASLLYHSGRGEIVRLKPDLLEGI